MMEDQIITLLKNSELREEICRVITEIYKDFSTFYDAKRNHDYMKLTEEERFNEVWVDAQLSTESEIEYLFRDYIFKKISVPHRIHLDEVLEILYDMFKPDARGSLCGDCEWLRKKSSVNFFILHRRFSRSLQCSCSDIVFQ